VHRDSADDGVELMTWHDAYDRKRSGHIAEHRLGDLGVGFCSQQLEGCSVINGLENEAAVVGAYPKGPPPVALLPSPPPAAGCQKG
jgi:hypothetical protein